MDNKTYWDALTKRYENMSELEFESIVANLDKTPEIPFSWVDSEPVNAEREDGAFADYGYHPYCDEG